MPKQHFLDLFFNPESIAIVGASRNPTSFNFNLVGNLVKLGFSGRIYPVNPSADEILGLRAYADLSGIEGDVDLVVSSVPAAMTLDVVKQCIEKKPKMVVLVTGGFSEIGEQGGKAQDEIAQLFRQGGIRVVGPNTLSPINSSNNLVISFHPVEKLRQGGVAFIFQSGMYEFRLNWLLFDFHLGISKLIDFGNKMDVNEVDALEYLAMDPDTKVIAMHLEVMKGDGKKFMQLLTETSKRKPIVILKSGCTEAGARASASHTGSMIEGSDAVFDTVLRQAGVVRARTVEDFFYFAKSFEFLPLPRGNRIVIASYSGGEGVVATDICQREGFSMARLGQEAIDKAEVVFPTWEIPLNPFDLGVCVQFHQVGEIYDILLEAILGDRGVDCLASQLVPIPSSSVAERLYGSFLAAKEKGKPIVLWRPVMDRVVNTLYEELVERLELIHIPVYPSAARAIQALSVVYRYKIMQEGAD